MSTTIAGLFIDHEEAAATISKLSDKGYVDKVSYLTKSLEGDVIDQEVGEDRGSAGKSVAAGAGIGALAGAVTGAVIATLPAATLVLAGPLALAWGVSGAALGGLSGGIAAALGKLGFDQEKAQQFEEGILAGQVMVYVDTDREHITEVIAVMQECGVDEVVELVED